MDVAVSFPHMVRVIACCAVLASCGPPIDSNVAVHPVSARERELADQILAQTEGYRNAKGSSPLRRHLALDRMATEHSQFLMANRGRFRIYGPNISHYGVENRAMSARYVHGMDQISENVVSAPLRGPSTASYLVGLWKESPSHDFNLRQTWTNTGVGVAIDSDGTAFVTQLFGSQSRGASHLAMLDQLKAH